MRRFKTSGYRIVDLRINLFKIPRQLSCRTQSIGDAPALGVHGRGSAGRSGDVGVVEDGSGLFTYCGICAALGNFSIVVALTIVEGGAGVGVYFWDAEALGIAVMVRAVAATVAVAVVRGVDWEFGFLRAHALAVFLKGVDWRRFEGTFNRWCWIVQSSG